MTRFVAVALVTASVFGADPAVAADSPLGTWKTVDEKSGKTVSEVQVYDQGADKDRAIVGLVILKDLSPGGDRDKGGTITDPEDGKVYKSELWLEGDTLKVRGYLGLFYRTQTWRKGN
jgi:uncharacterized protein (DUF2147 family)